MSVRLAILVFVAVVCLLGAPPPSPIHLSYATSDSMAPTIGTGDGFVLVSTGDVSTGDVVTFWSDKRGEHVTHRVVGRTGDGYITQGDANGATDQATGHPPVQREDIVGTVVSIGGRPVVVPELGAFVGWVQSNAVFGALGAAIAAGIYLIRRNGPGRVVQRRVPTVGAVVRPILIVGFVGCLVVVALVGSSAHHFESVAVEGTPTSDTEVTAGEPAERTYNLGVPTSVLTTTIVEAEGMTVDDRLSENGTVTLNATVHPPAEPGRFRSTVRIHSYPSVLPERTLRTLHSVHPLVAALVSVGVVFGPLFVLYLALFDRRTPLRPPRARRIRRLLGETR